MAYTLVPTKQFQKRLLRLTQQERNQVRNMLDILAENPYHPSLRTKSIQGEKDLMECSVNMDIRILWYYENDRVILLIDIGHHDILKRF